MKFYFIRSFNEHKNLLMVEREKISAHMDHINRIIPASEQKFYVPGYSIVAKKQVDFLCDFQYSSGFPKVNWRERLCCPETGFNNRMRFSIHLIDSLLNLNSGSKIYIMEQVTPMYSFLKNSYVNLIGSEYLGDSVPLGSVNQSNIRNEDVTSLTFEDESFDAILSYDVFEHISNFDLAFKECFRTLKRDGRLLFSAPFNSKSDKNIIRAILDESGDIRHLLEPEYHGDPVGSGKGILCYQYFGWEILDHLRKLGFRDAYAILGWSDEYCYFTPQIQFLALK
jgi:SAM-dependent methyltransferase